MKLGIGDSVLTKTSYIDGGKLVKSSVVSVR